VNNSVRGRAWINSNRSLAISNPIRSVAKTHPSRSLAMSNLSKPLAMFKAHQQAEAGGESTVSIHGENGINDGHLGVRASALFANAAADLRCAETQ